MPLAQISKSFVYEKCKKELLERPRKWVVTGAAGFIGSHLVEELLRLQQTVVGIDNLSSGSLENLREVSRAMPDVYRANFEFIQGDVSDPSVSRDACRAATFVLHQAAISSIPASLDWPIRTAETNILGFWHVVQAAREEKVRRVVFASSGSVYGDQPADARKEGPAEDLLSPYALSKYVNELSATMFQRAYEFDAVGLRYFNVFGPRQYPAGEYSAVIPSWIHSLLRGKRAYVFGDGETTRDFCYVSDVVQANILAAMAESPGSTQKIYNVSCGRQTSLRELYQIIRKLVGDEGLPESPVYQKKREGDIRHSYADISLITDSLGFVPEVPLEEGIKETIRWFRHSLTAHLQPDHPAFGLTGGSGRAVRGVTQRETAH